MNLKWIKGLGKDEEKELRADLIAARFAFKRLKVLLEEEVEAAQKDMSKKENFFMPAWGEYQAYRLGEIDALKMLLNFIEE